MLILDDTVIERGNAVPQACCDDTRNDVLVSFAFLTKIYLLYHPWDFRPISCYNIALGLLIELLNMTAWSVNPRK